MRAWRLTMPIVTAGLLAVGCRGLVWATAGPLDALRAGTATIDDMVGATAAGGAWLLLAWVVVVLGATALAGLPGAVGRVADRVGRTVTPAASQRLARLALGLAVATGPAAAGPVAMASPAFGEGPHVSAEALSTTGVDSSANTVGGAELPLIERPLRPGQMTFTTSTPPAAPPAREQESERTVVVQRGDTLWAIAADELGADASDADIAAEWPLWYETNREVIGPDPDLILPGTILRSPHEDTL